MTERGMEALRAEHREVLELAGSLTEEEWAAPSDCEGWRVQDVVAHMANTFRIAVDPGSLPAPVAGDIEATQAVHAAAHADWTPEQVLRDYEDMATRGLAMFEGFQSPDLASATFPMDNAGRYPLHLLPDLYTFDHFCHLRNDILQPNGPIDRRVAPPDELRLGVTLAWMVVGIPQMGGAALQAALSAPVGLRLTGPGGGEWTLLPAGGDDSDAVTVVDGLEDSREATATSSGEGFVLWATHRRPWGHYVSVEGNSALVGPVLDAIHVF